MCGFTSPRGSNATPPRSAPLSKQHYTNPPTSSLSDGLTLHSNPYFASNYNVFPTSYQVNKSWPDLHAHTPVEGWNRMRSPTVAKRFSCSHLLCTFFSRLVLFFTVWVMMEGHDVKSMCVNVRCRLGVCISVCVFTTVLRTDSPLFSRTMNLS